MPDSIQQASATSGAAIFLSHGAPTLALEDSPTGRFLDALGRALPRPRAVLVASAHFDRRQPTLTAGARPRTVHDFGGFPEALYRIDYPAHGAPDLASEAQALLRAGGVDAALDAGHGFDHGVWVPLLRMFPGADVPVVALSIDSRADAATHYRVGRALAPLARDGVLVLGSGGYSHNLGELAWHATDAATPAWASEFTDWLRARLVAGEVEQALAWSALAPNAQRNHPTTEHLMPLFVAWGAGGEGAIGRSLHHGWEMASLAMDAFAFAPN